MHRTVEVSLAAALMGCFGAIAAYSDAEPIARFAVETVSPGAAVSETGVPGPSITQPCPTFSWSAQGRLGAREGSGTLQVVVYPDASVATGGLPSAEAQPMLAARIPGSARSWTPSGVRCLESGSYVWFVGVERGDEVLAWSRGAGFRVSSRIVDDRSDLASLIGGAENRGVGAVRGGDANRAGESVESEQTVASTLSATGFLEAGSFHSMNEPFVIPGTIEADGTEPSVALGVLRANRFRLTLGPGGDDALDLQDVAGFLALTLPGQDVPVTLTLDFVEIDRLLAGTGGIFVPRTGWEGTGGSGFFQIPSLGDVTVDNNASDCVNRTVSAVRLEETDSGQIGIQVRCSP